MAIPNGVSKFDGASPKETAQKTSGGKRGKGSMPKVPKSSNPATSHDGASNMKANGKSMSSDKMRPGGLRVKQPFAPSGIKAKERAIKDPKGSDGLMSHE